jgi:hypothetical protein
VAYLLGELDGVLAAVVETDLGVLHDGVVHHHREVGAHVHLLDVRHRLK